MAEEFNTDEDYADKIANELSKSNSTRLAKKVNDIVDIAASVDDHVYTVKLEVHYNDVDLTSLSINPKKGTHWWNGGENTTGEVHAILGPRGGATTLDYRDSFSDFSKDYSKGNTRVWPRFFKRLERLN